MNEEMNKETPADPQGESPVNEPQEKKKGRKGVFRKGNGEEAWQEKLQEANDKYLRLFAEFDNYRKRTQREKAEMSAYGSEAVIHALLPVMDDFERAMQSMTPAAGLDAVREGVTLIYGKLSSVLEQKGLTVMQTKGARFDTDFHEAITSIEAGDDMKGKVVDEVQKGYLFNGRVLRFAKVVVGI
ncbi:MAG TPA: nucleotide exchange factor GrpE [Bacteroidales bacterium]|nr:nucleotide exchange factor GrpE [Bacteroidales bacterium]HSA44266.1 nucleotide exchange factor GrpE [Bacteroidales bacterium]